MLKKKIKYLKIFIMNSDGKLNSAIKETTGKIQKI